MTTLPSVSIFNYFKVSKTKETFYKNWESKTKIHSFLKMSRSLLVIFAISAFILSCSATPDDTCGNRVCSQQMEPLCVHDSNNRCYFTAGNYCLYGILICQDRHSKFYF
ncbi:hypothetical protein ACFFRR_003830 [Megaselia abdita]